MAEVSFVVIAKNEEALIERCLASCWEAASRAGASAEVILADSSSTDRTVELALPLVTVVLRLPEVGAPFAGRCEGTRVAVAPFIQFLDGDMTLDPAWLACGLSAMRSNGKLGAIAGQSREAVENPHLRRMNAKAEAREAAEGAGRAPRELWGGAMLIRRESLLAAGGFHPFLVGLEQLDISWRIAHAGLELRRLPDPMSIHYGYAKRLTLAEEARKRWRTYFLGEGFLLRYYMRRYPSLAPRMLAREARAFLLLLAEAAVLLGLAALGGAPAIAMIALLPMVAILVLRFAPPGRRWADAARSGLWAHLSAAGIVAGFLSPNRLPEEYPHERVQAARGSGEPDPERVRMLLAAGRAQGPSDQWTGR